MHSTRSLARVGLAGLATASVAAAGVAGVAYAKPNPYSPKAICGAGFGVIDQRYLHEIADGKVRDLGTVYLMYNARTGENCVTTVKKAGVGKKTPVRAFLKVQKGMSASQSGAFAYYAGPVKLKARGKCVRFGGSVRVGTRFVSSDTITYSHCGK